MIKKSLLLTLLMALLVPWAANAQQTVQIGEGTATSNQVPIGTYYNYSITEQLYTAEEIGMEGSISSISFYYLGIAAKDLPITVYMMNTDAANLSTGISLADANEVFNGTLSVPATAGWVTINLDSPFEYDGSSNLLIGINKSYVYYFSGQSWQGTSVSNMARYTQNDNTAYTTSTIPGTAASVRPNIQLEIAPSGGVTCDKPETLTAVASDNPSYPATHAILLQWEGGSGIYNVQIKKASQSADEWVTKAAYFTENALLIHSLDAGTAYNARVQSVCYDNEGGIDPEIPDFLNREEFTSGWRSVDFTTACDAITTFPWSEDFESYAAGDFNPSCWVNEHISGNGSSIFKVATTTVNGNATHKLQLPDMSNGTMTKLVLPEMSLPDNYLFSIDVCRNASGSSYTSEGVRVFVSADGEIEGATELAFLYRNFTQTDGNLIPAESAVGWYTYELPIPMSGTCYIILRGESQYGSATYMDNFIVKEVPACPKPTGVAVSNVTAHDATISWTSDASAWEIQLNEEEVITVNEPTYTITGLTPETPYSVKVRANCGDDVYSEWTVPVSFTTGIACPVPTALAVALTPGNGSVATLSWASDASAWVVAYKTADATDFTEVNVTENTYTLTGLTPETAYTAKVKAVCGGEDGESQWTSTISFTPTNAYTVTVNDGTTTNGYVPIYGYYCDDITKSQFIIPANALADMVYGTINKLTFYANNANVSWGSATFEVYMTETTETTLSALADYNSMEKVKNAGSLSISGNKMVVEFDAPYQYMGDNLMIGFLQITTGNFVTSNWYGVSATGASMGGYGTSISQRNFLPKTTFDYVPGEAPACPKPMSLTASDVTPHEATITWISDASAWEIQLNEEEVITVDEPTYTFTGLAPETPYSVKVRANCDGAYSDWTAPVSFTTGIACPVPTQILVSDITGYTAVVSWVSQAESFNMMLDTIVYENVTSPYELTGLQPETNYTVKVKAICGGEDGESQWSNGTSFKTAEICPEGMVCIGTGTSTNQYLPTYTYYNYSLTQQIYTAAEIGQSGEITSVGFYKSGTSNIARNLSIYLVSTEKETFSGSSDWIAVTASDLVYSGNVTFQNDAWTTIEFNSPFLYDGTTNIALIVDDNTGSYVSAPTFYAFGATSQAIRVYSDGTNYDATAPSSYSGSVLNMKNRIRIAIGEPPACPKPTGVAVNYTGGNTAIVTWNGEAETFNIDVNGEVTDGVSSPYTLEGLELATTYNVMVQAICNAMEFSEWTTPVSFTTDLCMPEDKCEITFELTDSYGDGWNGAYISVIDVATGEELAQMSNNNIAKAAETEIYTLAVCNGSVIQFVWHNGSYDSECSFVIKDLNDEVIVEGNSSALPFTYTVNCTVVTCKKPQDLVASDINKTSVVLSWTPGSEDQNAWRIAYMSENDSTYSYKNVTSNVYTLNGLTPETVYTVKVRANCGGGDYSNWSDEISFTTADACPADIYAFSVYNITVQNALLSWTGDYNSYQVRYKSIVETEWSDVYSTNEASIALFGLEASTTYEYQVQGYCADVDAYTEWVDATSYFTTQSICGAPQNLYAVPGINSATISWTGYQNTYQIACGETVETVYGTTYTLEGLESSHEYTVTVIGLGEDCGAYESATLEFTTGAGWDDPNAWAEPGVLNDSTIVVIEPGDEPILIPEDITIGDGSYIVIEPGAEVIYSGEDPIPVVLGFDDDEEDEDAKGPRCRDELPGGYRLIASPVFNSATEPFVSVVSTHLMDLPDDYFANDLYSFDLNYPRAEWRNYKEVANNFVNLNWKQGYLYYGDYTKVNWQGHIVANTNNSVEIALDYNEANTYLPGLNLIGNPFWAKGYPDMNFYVLNQDGNEVVASGNNYVGRAKGFFVVATAPGQSCTVNTNAPDTRQSLDIALTQDCSLIDAAAIRFNDTKENLAKIQLNPNHTKIYMPLEGKDYAILHGEGLGEMPLNFEAEENGTYTLSFASEEVSFSYLHLIDNMTGDDVNLLANPSYSFEAKTTDYASRFRLVYATGSSVDGDNFGFINSMGNLSIYGIEGVATLQVMDVTGRILSTETFSGSYERKLNVAPGVYMLRLIQGNDAKVQKMVIR